MSTSSYPPARFGFAAAFALAAAGVFGAGLALRSGATNPLGLAPAPLVAKASLDVAPLGALPPAVNPFGALPPAASPQAVDSGATLSGIELSAFNEAASLYRKGALAQADIAASGVADPIARAALDWIALRVNTTAARLNGFALAHPGWPMADWVRSTREGWLYAGKPTPDETQAAFADAAPTTPLGRIALARAELAQGKRDEAAATVRALWRDPDLDGAAEATTLREFGALLTRDDHRARADRLLYLERGAAAWRAAALAGPDVLALASARMEAAKGPLSPRAALAVPISMREDFGFFFAHTQDARRSGRIAEADAWIRLAHGDAAKLVDPDKWWSERRMVARAWLDRGEFEKAYALCAEATTASSPAHVDAAFHAGWIALRFLNDPARAATHFAEAAEAAETPLSIARADYWRGRAAEAQGQTEAAHGFYVQAAAYPIAYYGQLAAAKLGSEPITLRHPAAKLEGEARAEATRVIELFLANGLDDYVGPLAYAAAREWTDPAELAALAETLRRRASPATNVVFGKLATERGFPLDAAAFPTFGVPAFAPLAGSAGAAEVMAIARQESEFLPRAASGVGARGLMQIMPATAADTARKLGMPYDYNRLTNDPAYNMQLGAAYFGQLVAGEGGSLPMAAAAYNAGAGRVAQWVAAYGDPRAGADMVDWVERIPYDETRDYVMRVMENYAVYQARLAEAPEPRALAALARR